MKKLVLAAVAVMAMVSVSNVFAGVSTMGNNSGITADTTETKDTVVVPVENLSDPVSMLNDTVDTPVVPDSTVAE